MTISIMHVSSQAAPEYAVDDDGTKQCTHLLEVQIIKYKNVLQNIVSVT